MIFHRPWILRTPLTSFSCCMSSSSKSTNPYVTLKVDPSATQEEIKASYYKLTKLYHPDVNKTEEAKEKFRNVSEAYEIIGNYKARKKYDRGMKAQGYTRPSEKEEKDNPHMAFYKSRMDRYPKPVRTADSKTFDFDAWTRAHYGDTLKRTIHRRAVNREAQYFKDHILVNEKAKDKENKIGIITIIVLLLSVLLLEVREDFDVVVKKEESAEKSE